MRLPEALEDFPDGTDTSRVFGEPYQTPKGATVIPVSKLRYRSDGRVHARPLGIFVIGNGDGKPTWVPAVDTTRIALFGVLVGVVSATLAGVAMVRRPPWPDLHGDISRSI